MIHMQGTIRTNEDFVVREVINDKFLRKFTRTGKGVAHANGSYSIYLMKKNGENTKDAIRKIAEHTGIKEIGYAGLKDKNAITYQYVSAKNASFDRLDMGNISLSSVSKSSGPISVGDLMGNNFEIMLHNADIEKIDDVMKHISRKGFPNMFGHQRFGVNMDNYIIGRHIVKRNFDKAEKMIMDHGRNFIEKDDIKFFIHSYQSWIFNSVLSRCIEKNKVPEKLPLVGYGSKISNEIMKGFLDKEGISPGDFRINELKICCRGSERDTFVKTDISYTISKNKVLLKFFLPKGCYATSLLEEIKKM